MGRILACSLVAGSCFFFAQRAWAQNPPPAQPAPAPAPAPGAVPPPPAAEAPPPAAAPPTQVQPAQPPPQQYPAPQPYPAQTYPAPAPQGYPPAQQYPAAEPYPATAPPAYPERAPVPPAPRYPPDAAVRTSPWFDLTVGSFLWTDRIDEFMNVGIQVGAYLGKRVRLSGRAFMPTEDADDQYPTFNDDPFGSLDNDSFVLVDSEPARFLFGANLGVVAVSNKSFVMSPGLMFLRSDVSDYGTMVGLSLPFEWVTTTGMRVGFEFDIGRAFGGTVLERCVPGTGTTVCQTGETRTIDREPGTAFLLHFQLGWGFNHPEPEPVTAAAVQR